MSYRREKGSRYPGVESYDMSEYSSRPESFLPDYGSDADSLPPDYGSDEESPQMKPNRSLWREGHGRGSDPSREPTPVEDVAPDYSDEEMDTHTSHTSHTRPVQLMVAADVHSSESDHGSFRRRKLSKKDSGTGENGSAERSSRDQAGVENLAYMGDDEGSARNPHTTRTAVPVTAPGHVNQAFDGNSDVCVDIEDVYEIPAGDRNSIRRSVRKDPEERVRSSKRQSSMYKDPEKEAEEIQAALADLTSKGTIKLKSNKKRQVAWGIAYARQQGRLQSDSKTGLDDIYVEDLEEVSEGSVKGPIPEDQVAAEVSRIYSDVLNKDQVIATPTTKLTGVKKWRHQRSKEWKSAQKRWREVLANFEVWRGAMKSIEGHFGASVLSYFNFLKWLLGLNVLIAALVLAVIVLPQEILDPRRFSDTVNMSMPSNTFLTDATNCSGEYDNFIDITVQTRSTGENVIDFIQGTGWMEQTVLFYGYYFNKTYTFLGVEGAQNYNMPLGFLLCIVFYFLLSLFFMVRYTARGVQESLASQGDKFYHFCDKILVGWDYNLTKDKSATYKHNNLFRDYKISLAEQRRLKKLTEMKLTQKCGLYCVRVLINLIVVGVWVGCGWAIVYTTDVTAELASQQDITDNDFLSLLVQFLTPLAITLLNIIVPVIFQKVVLVEDYKPDTQLKITIFRTVFLRLASIAVLVVSLREQIIGCSDEVQNQDKCKDCDFYCWETYVGQQFYKLVILDFATVVVITFFIEFPRKFFVTRFKEFRLCNLVGQQEFEIPQNVLDLVYSQTLCWLGAMFSPLIPAITVAKLFFYFYVKKLTLLHNCIPSSKPYQASSSNTFFMTILLVSFCLCVAPVLYTLTRVPPSNACGPFRVYSGASFHMWTVFSDAMDSWPKTIRDIFHYMGTWTFFVPMVILLFLILYYYMAVAAGNRRLIALLKEQLALEGKDKQFLLNQVRQALVRGDFKTE